MVLPPATLEEHADAVFEDVVALEIIFHRADLREGVLALGVRFDSALEVVTVLEYACRTKVNVSMLLWGV